MNIDLLRKIAAEDEMMPSQSEWHDLQALEAAGLVKEASLLHPVAITYRLTDKGRAVLAAERSTD